jgi:hypothetical protein
MKKIRLNELCDYSVCWLIDHFEGKIVDYEKLLAY